MLLLDATHTSHTQAQTGIQRVTRALFAALTRQQDTTGICFDHYLKDWRSLNRTEFGRMQPGLTAAGSRGAVWPWHQRFAGRARRVLGIRPGHPAGDALVCPELFAARTAKRFPELRRAVAGPCVAVFYDAIPLKFPELTPPTVVARFPAYLRELLEFDGVAAISEDSAASLRDYWNWLGVTDAPPVLSIPLAVDPQPMPAPADVSPTAIPRVLCVGTIEGRKNHLALLEACESLWGGGASFELQLIGMPRADTAGPALARISALQGAGRPLLFRGMADDADLVAAYQRCAFTVYPSLIEGFGLPVLESLQHGKPCICSALGPTGESARGGGCLALDSVDAPSLAAAIRKLLEDRAELSALTSAARGRSFRSWADYARDLTAWMRGLPRRS